MYATWSAFNGKHHSPTGTLQPSKSAGLESGEEGGVERARARESRRKKEPVWRERGRRGTESGATAINNGLEFIW